MRGRGRWTRAAGIGGITCALVFGLWAGAAPEPPVLLIYGFQPIPGFRATDLWTRLAEQLSGRPVSDARPVTLEPGHTLFALQGAGPAGRDVYISDYTLRYEPTMRDLRFYARRIADEIAWITANAGSGRVDLVAHSMGGLIARAYLEASDFAPIIGSPGFPDYGLRYRGDVRTLVTLATPHHGTEFASSGVWFGTLSNQLAPDSEFLRRLNLAPDEDPQSALNPGVRYASFAGQSCLGCGLRRDEDDCLRACIVEGLAWRGSDLVILMESAYLPGAENYPCLGMNHVDLREHPAVCEAIAALLDGRPVPKRLFRSDSLRDLVDHD